MQLKRKSFYFVVSNDWSHWFKSMLNDVYFGFYSNTKHPETQYNIDDYKEFVLPLGHSEFGDVPFESLNLLHGNSIVATSPDACLKNQRQTWPSHMHEVIYNPSSSKCWMNGPQECKLLLSTFHSKCWRFIFYIFIGCAQMWCRS